MNTKTKTAPVPRLVCNISGRDRVTTREYLDAKLENAGMTQEEFLAVYVCKDAMKMLRNGMSIDEIRAALKSTATAPITADELKKMLAVNGKQRGAAGGPVLSERERKHREHLAAEKTNGGLRAVEPGAGTPPVPEPAKPIEAVTKPVIEVTPKKEAEAAAAPVKVNGKAAQHAAPVAAKK